MKGNLISQDVETNPDQFIARGFDRYDRLSLGSFSFIVASQSSIMPACKVSCFENASLDIDCRFLHQDWTNVFRVLGTIAKTDLL